MGFIRQLVSKRERQTGDLWAEYRTLLRRVTAAGHDRELPQKDADRATQLVGALGLTPADVARHLDIVARYDVAKPKAGLVPAVEARLAKARAAVDAAIAEADRQAKANQARVHELHHPVTQLENELSRLRADAMTVYEIEASEHELLGLPAPAGAK